jgi:UDP-N-acetylglucosamine 2-epimerase (non-hydrolysing)
MLLVVYGTTGELIKLAPVLTRLDLRREVRTVCTGQQVEQIPTLLSDLGLPPVDVWLAEGRRGHDLQTLADLRIWLPTLLRRFAHARGWLRREAGRGAAPLVLVHGDTMTTVLGAAMGRLLGVPVAHVEAGLRSGSWRDPFPEELDRRMTSRLASLHFAPGPWAAENLRRAGVSGEIVDTGANTIRDTLGLVDPGAVPGVPVPAEPFGLVSIHRFELLEDKEALRATVDVLREASGRMPLLFIGHPVTLAAVRAAGLEDRFDERFRCVPRQRYFPFIALLKASRFLLTDSGGSQEECTQFGLPCLVHRANTERLDGLAEGIVTLSRMDLGVVRRFLADPPPRVPVGDGAGPAPSDVIVEALRARGFLPRSGLTAAAR